jgi:hypothetical protein
MSVDPGSSGASPERGGKDAPQRKGVLRGGHDPRELARRSVEARKRKREQQPAPVEEELDVDAEIARLGMRAWTDRQLVKLAANGRNAAASVASLKELRNRQVGDTGTDAVLQAVKDARAELIAMTGAIAERRQHTDPRHCPTCGQPRGGGVVGTDGVAREPESLPRTGVGSESRAVECFQGAAGGSADGVSDVSSGPESLPTRYRVLDDEVGANGA